MQTTRLSFLAGASALAVRPASAVAAVLDADGDPVDCKRDITTPDAALRELDDGNERFRNRPARHPNQSPERRRLGLQGQCPFATIVSCSDSRVPPEIIFDQGLGDLFVCRVAGNTTDAAALGSIEYAMKFHPNLIIVLAHEQCGAVEAALRWIDTGTAPNEHVRSAVRPIYDNLVRSTAFKPATEDKDRWAAAARTNARLVAEQLFGDPHLLPQLAGPNVRVYWAYYEFESGIVRHALVPKRFPNGKPAYR